MEKKLIGGSQNMVIMSVVMSDPYAYGFDEKSEVRDKLLTDWARIRLTKMAEMSIFWIGHITAYAGVLPRPTGDVFAPILSR
jgi:hypothetical protein